MDPASKQAAKYKTQSLLGIINDKVEVGMAKIRGEDSAALDVAIIKATLQDEVVPKEKHVRTLKAACNGSSPRQTVNYVIHGLAKRLEDNSKSWLVTLKTLIVFHRLMRETDHSFQEELLRYAERTGHHRMLRLESFADHTTKETWDLSAFIRVYSLYLDERLAVFRAMRFDPEQDQGLESRESKLKNCAAAELLGQLPAVQRLLGRLVSCVPEGASQTNEIALLACSLVLQEVRSVYKVVCEGVLNLVDKFFEMDRGDMLKGVELVKENLAVNERLNAFVATIGGIPPLRGAVQFPAVQPLPADFLTTLEDYVKDAPKTAGDGGKLGLGRSASAALRGPASAAPRLVVGGPIKDPPSGPTSPQPAQAAPAPAAEVDLLGGFESLTVNPTPPPAAAPAAPPAPAPAMPPAPAPAPPPPAPFDPFAGFGAAPAPAPVPVPQPAAAAAAPPPPAYPYGQSASFPQPAAPGMAPAGGPYGYHSAPPPVSPQPPVAHSFNDAMFGGANAFGAPPPGYPSPTAPAAVPPPPPPQPQPPASGPTPFNPFANPNMHAAVAPHMPQPPTPATPPPPASAPVPPAPAPQQQMPPPPAYAPMAPSPQPQPQGMGAFANPFGSPGAPSPAAAPANPFSSPASTTTSPPQAVNPFGGAVASSTQQPPAGNNPFAAAAAPGAGAWPGAVASPAVVSQQVGGYNLKKPADPLHDLSFDLFGKQQAPAVPQPMRPQGAPNGAGSPGNFI